MARAPIIREDIHLVAIVWANEYKLPEIESSFREIIAI
jgi:hypothetical protein